VRALQKDSFRKTDLATRVRRGEEEGTGNVVGGGGRDAGASERQLQKDRLGNAGEKGRGRRNR